MLINLKNINLSRHLSQKKTGFRTCLLLIAPYALAFLLVVTAVIVRMLLTALIGLRFPLLLFLLAIMGSARFGGRWPGLAATLVSTLCLWYFILPPQFNFSYLNRAELINLFVFIVVGVGMSLMVGQLRQERAELLRSRGALLRHTELLDKAQEPMFSWESGGGITYWNVGAENLYGYKRQEALGRASHELLQTAHPLGINEIETLVLAQGGWKGELRHRGKDGHVIVVESMMTAVRNSRSGRSIIETNHDITERKQWEEALLRANEDLRQFAYIAAHDLQEPLRNVSLTLDLLKDSYRQKIDDEGIQLIEESIRGARRMHLMVKDLLSFTRISSSSDEIAANLDPNEILVQALENFRLLIAETGAQIQAEQLPSIRMQRAHMLQLFQNLLSNALKYRKSHEVPQISISAKQKGSDWLFTVSDNGIGFEQIYAERIFGIFKRLHQSYEYEGTGIGLAICARIVALYKGRIWAESDPGKGAKFTFSVPVEWHPTTARIADAGS